MGGAVGGVGNQAMEPWSVLWSNCKSKEGRGSPLQQTDRAKGTTQHQGGHDMRQPQVPIPPSAW